MGDVLLNFGRSSKKVLVSYINHRLFWIYYSFFESSSWSFLKDSFTDGAASEGYRSFCSELYLIFCYPFVDVFALFNWNCDEGWNHDAISSQSEQDWWALFIFEVLNSWMWFVYDARSLSSHFIFCIALWFLLLSIFLT